MKIFLQNTKNAVSLKESKDTCNKDIQCRNKIM